MLLVVRLLVQHERLVLHRDLKTNNIFLKRNLIKLGDFGIARVLQGNADQATTFAGTPYYMSPEVLQSKGYNAKSDIWSLGCVIIELCLLEQAFKGQAGLLGLMFEICEGDLPQLPEMYSKELRAIGGDLLNRDPAKRPAAQDILQMPFVASHIEELREELSQTQIGREQNQIRSVATKKKHRKPSAGPHTAASSQVRAQSATIVTPSIVTPSAVHDDSGAMADAAVAALQPRASDAFTQPRPSAEPHRRTPSTPTNAPTPPKEDVQLTPRQRLALRKQQAADKRAAELRDFARGKASENAQHTADRVDLHAPSAGLGYTYTRSSQPRDNSPSFTISQPEVEKPKQPRIFSAGAVMSQPNTRMGITFKV